jgi:hypothetical protein
VVDEVLDSCGEFVSPLIDTLAVGVAKDGGNDDRKRGPPTKGTAEAPASRVLPIHLAGPGSLGDTGTFGSSAGSGAEVIIGCTFWARSRASMPQLSGGMVTQTLPPELGRPSLPKLLAVPI